MDIYILPDVKYIASGKQEHKHREISSVLCVPLEGWDREGGREGWQEGGREGKGKEGRKEGRRKGRKEGKKEGRGKCLS